MLEVGVLEPPLNLDSVDVKTVSLIKGLERNKIFVVRGSVDNLLIITAANSYEDMELIPFKRWRVIGMGIFWITASTANEDPVVEFGTPVVHNAFGTMTSSITGGEKFNVYDQQKYDPMNILGDEVITEASATLVVTWTTGAEFNVWKTGVEALRIHEAAVAGMTTGIITPYLIIEVDTGGKW